MRDNHEVTGSASHSSPSSSDGIGALVALSAKWKRHGGHTHQNCAKELDALAASLTEERRKIGDPQGHWRAACDGLSLKLVASEERAEAAEAALTAEIQARQEAETKYQELLARIGQASTATDGAATAFTDEKG